MAALPAPKADRLTLAYARGWTPPPRLSVPDWADRYRHLAREAGSTSGRWRTSTVEIARGPMLAVTEPGVHIVTAMVATQLLKTELICNTVGYFAHLDPCPLLMMRDSSNKERRDNNNLGELRLPFLCAEPF
ncbi:MAG: phage terminase large subunit family protein [Sphingomonadaceae bacterium]|nr:phage terminase large subunit family protein [Sphingomonadaceae bacterium]